MHSREIPNELEQDITVHLNHFVSATPRYDDTKYVEAERSRAGLFRTPADPVLAIDITSGYFAGTGTTGYKWSTDNPTIDKDSSAMMRYRITLSNLSDDQMKLLNFTGQLRQSADLATAARLRGLRRLHAARSDEVHLYGLRTVYGRRLRLLAVRLL